MSLEEEMSWISVRDAASLVVVFLAFFAIVMATVGLAYLLKELVPTVREMLGIAVVRPLLGLAG